MKTLFAAVLVAGTLAGFSAANAAGGCGPGFHRGPYGGCRPNGGAVVVGAPRRGRAGPGRGGAARPRLPLRLRLALWTLPPDLRFSRHSGSRRKPRPGNPSVKLTNNNGGARTCGASDGGGANSGGGNPRNGGAASPNGADNPSGADSPSGGATAPGPAQDGRHRPGLRSRVPPFAGRGTSPCPSGVTGGSGAASRAPAASTDAPAINPKVSFRKWRRSITFLLCTSSFAQR